MEEHVEFNLDRALFSAEVIAKAAHRFTGDFFVRVATTDDGFVVRMTPMDRTKNVESLEDRFHNEALDERLREHVHAATHDIQVTLMQAALKNVIGLGSE